MKNKLPSYKGEQNDTYRANAYALKCMFITFSVLFFCWVLDVLNIFIVDLRIMNIGTGGAAVVCLLAAVYAFTVGIDKPSSRYVVMFLLVLMMTVICTELAYHTTMLMMFPVVCSTQYFDKKISLFTAIITCAGFAVAVMLGYRIGLCDSNMVLLTYTNSATHVAELLEGTFSINSDKSLMFLFFVFPKWLTIVAIMPMLNHVARDIQARTAREAMARHMAEMDGLTGIYNRTKYLQDISSYYLSCDKLVVLFFDVNNLKTLNDTRGHEYGDILICGLAEELKKRESQNCRSYRIGGDEFVMVIENADENYGRVFREQIDKQLQGKPLEQGICLSVAIGLACGKGKNIESIVKEADEDMYAKKTAMKKAGLA